MKRLAFFLCCFALAFVSLRAHADLDPSIGIGDPSCSSWNAKNPTNPAINESSNFFTFSPVSGGGILPFCNTNPNGLSWHTIDIVVPEINGISFSSVTCSTIGKNPPFDGCTKKDLPGGYLDLFFSNPGTCEGDACGIPKNQVMVINLNCVPSDTNPCSGSWPDVTFTSAPNGTAGSALNFVPEPASLSLLASGLLALWGLRRRRH